MNKYNINDVIYVTDKKDNYFIGKISDIKLGRYYFDIYNNNFMDYERTHFSLHLIDDICCVEIMNNNEELLKLLYKK